MLFYNIPIETLNSLYNNKFEDLEIKKHPKVLLKILFLINKFEDLEV